MKRLYLALIVGVVATLILFFYVLVADKIPPTALTESSMWLTKRRIIHYANEKRHLPEQLSQLAPMHGYNNRLVDAWGRPIIYSHDSKDIVTLSSLGADGLPGGVGLNADIVHQFAICSVEGCVTDELDSWLK